jgi:hypothetical protein
MHPHRTKDVLELRCTQIAHTVQDLFQPLAKSLQGRKLVLYAGTPKTGTTSLQHWLMLNRQGLYQKGVLYPRNVLNQEKPKHQWLLESLKPAQSSLISVNSELIDRELAEHSGTNIHTVILSTEGLYNHFHEYVYPLRECWSQLANQCRMQIVITFRNPFDFALSRYRQNLINPHSDNPYHATTETLASLCQDPQWMQSLDYPSFVEFWEEVVGQTSIACLPYSTLSPASFCHACNIDLSNEQELLIRKNVSFGALSADLLRAMNGTRLSPHHRSIAIQRILDIEHDIGQSSLPVFRHTQESRKLIWNYCEHRYMELIAKRPELTIDLRITKVDCYHEQDNGSSPALTTEIDAAFICCIQPGFLEEQTILLAQSIRLFGGKLRDCPIYAISPIGEPLSTTTTRVLESLRVKIDTILLNTQMQSFAYANKAYALEHAEATYGHSINIFLDSDTLFIDEPIAFQLSQDIDFLARPVDLRGICSSPNDNLFHQYWKDCCEISAINLDDLPIIRTTVDRVDIHSNWNGGLLVTRGGTGIGTRWREILEELWANQVCARPLDFWGSGQVSFTLATASLHLKGAILPNGYNIPIHLDPSAIRIDDIQEATHIHYHWMLEKDSHSEGISRIKSLKPTKCADLFVSALEPFTQRRGDSCTGFQ